MAAGEIAIYTIEDLERERGLDERLRWELVEGTSTCPTGRSCSRIWSSRHLSRSVTKVWLVLPDVSLRVWHLAGGGYRLHAHAAGDQEVRLTEPAELTFRVADLLPPRRRT